MMDCFCLLVFVLWQSKSIIPTVCERWFLIGLFVGFFSDVHVIKSIRRVLAFFLFTESPIFLDTIESNTGKFTFKTVYVKSFAVGLYIDLSR